MNEAPTQYLIVGGDGLLGSNLVLRLRSLGECVVATTRRAMDPGKHLIRLDLSSDAEVASWTHPTRADVAVFCAGVTSLASCETAPAVTRQINVTNTLILAKKLYSSGARIIFLSSNAVFDGNSILAEENSAYCPSTEYGRQKAAVEKELFSLSAATGSVKIVRLAKVLTSTSGMASEFIKKLSAGQFCPAFDDLRISPVSLSYVLDSILTITMSHHSGIFNLSGAEEMTYADFAMRLAGQMGVDHSYVQPTSSLSAGVKVLFRPVHPALGMKRTSALTGIVPEPTAHLLAQLVSGK